MKNNNNNNNFYGHENIGDYEFTNNERKIQFQIKLFCDSIADRGIKMQKLVIEKPVIKTNKFEIS